MAIETSSVDVNDSVGQQLDGVNPQFMGSLSKREQRDSAEFNVRGDGDASNSVHWLINEMSYIHNASSNDNLLSPYMFSNNSISPSNQNPLQLGDQ